MQNEDNTTDRYLAALLESNKVVFDEMFRENFPVVRHYVNQNGGTDEDAEDVFYDAIMVIYRKAKDGSLKLDSSFGAYLYGVCKNLWLNRLQKRRPQSVTFSADDKWEGDSYFPDFKQAERQRLMDRCMAKLGKDCQEVLFHFFQGKPLKELAAQKGEKEEAVRTRKHRCLKELINCIKRQPEFGELSED